MTRAEILNCLTDRPCDVCKFHESGKCERWECVFEEKPDDAEESRETDDYENEIADLQNRLDIAEYDRDRWKEKVTVLEEKLKSLSAEPCEDCVSLRDVIRTIDWWVYYREPDCRQLVIWLKERINELPSVTPKQKMGRWIPVSERLPSCSGMYIVTRKIYDCPDTAPIIMSDESWFDGQNTWHNDNRINHSRRYLHDVIAWMPLPEPYKEENEVTQDADNN